MDVRSSVLALSALSLNQRISAAFSVDQRKMRSAACQAAVPPTGRRLPATFRFPTADRTSGTCCLRRCSEGVQKLTEVIHRRLRGVSRGSPRRRMNNFGKRIRSRKVPSVPIAVFDTPIVISEILLAIWQFSGLMGPHRSRSA